MTAELELRIEYQNEDAAGAVFKALEPDNEGLIESKIECNAIIFNISSDCAGTLRNAADDLLACVKIAEEALGISYGIPDLDGDAFSE
jgi:tRNA threonylcarbamoyladenosine modification (KEOPS) complex  Pcc1 subunit